MALNTKVGGVFQQNFNSVFLLKDNRNELLTVSPKTRAGLHFSVRQMMLACQRPVINGMVSINRFEKRHRVINGRALLFTTGLGLGWLPGTFWMSIDRTFEVLRKSPGQKI